MTLFARSYEVQQLVDLLGSAEPGDTVTYEQMEEQIGRSVRDQKGRGRLQSARKLLLKDRKAFDCVPRVGLRRVPDAEIARVLDGQIKRIHRAAQKGRKVSTCVIDFEALPRDRRTELVARQSLLGIVEMGSRARKVKQLEGSFSKDEDPKPPSIGEIFKRLTNGSS